MIRGLGESVGKEQMYAWSKKDSNKEANAFSVTYLRADTPILRFAKGYLSGFIYYPHKQTPTKKNTYKVFCFFPLDGWTDYRKGKHGCGKSKKQIKVHTATFKEL